MRRGQTSQTQGAAPRPSAAAHSPACVVQAALYRHRRSVRSVSLGPQPLARKASLSADLLKLSSAAAVFTARGVPSRVAYMLQQPGRQLLEERRLQLDATKLASLLLHRGTVSAISSGMALRLARAASAVIQALALLPLDSLTAVDAWATGTKLERYVDGDDALSSQHLSTCSSSPQKHQQLSWVQLSRLLTTARAVFVRRLGATASRARACKALLTAAVPVAYARALSAEDVQRCPRVHANGTLSRRVITASADVARSTHAVPCAGRARKASFAALAAEESSDARACLCASSTVQQLPCIGDGRGEDHGGRHPHSAAASTSQEVAWPQPAGVTPKALLLACKACRSPLACQASLEVLRNETVVHEVGVTDGLLQVKADGGAAAGSSQQRTILHDKRWAAIEAATLAGNMEPLAHLIASAQRRVDEVAMPCQCHSGIAVITTTAAAADAHMAGAARMSTADTTAPLDVHFDLPEFVAAFRGVANALSRACHHERRAVIQRELDGFLQLAAGHDAMRLGGLANVQVLGAVRTALEWLLGTIDQVHRDMLNNQLRAMTTYLRTEGASHESGLAYSRLAAAPYCLRATRHFVHRAVAIVTAEASGASSDATLQANATALLSALRASPSPSTAAVAGLLVRGVLGGVLVDTKVAGTGACRGPCEAPETLVFDGMRLQQSAAAVETSAAAAAIAMAVTGTGRGLGPQHTAQLLTLLEAPDLTPAHIAAQAVQWAQGQGAGVSSCSSGTAAHVRGVVMAICERQSPLRELYLRRCLLAVSSMTAESRCCGGSAGRTSGTICEQLGLPNLSAFLAARAATPLLAVACHNVLVYADAYAAFIAEALVRTEQ